MAIRGGSGRCSSRRSTSPAGPCSAGMGATVALPFLDAMVPARTLFAKTRRLGPTRLVVHRDGARRGRQHRASALAKNLWSPAAVGRAFDLSPSASARSSRIREYLTIVSNTDVRNGRGVRAEGNRRRPFPLERGVPDAERIRSRPKARTCCVGASLDQIYAQRFGQDTPIPSMQLCIENVDQAGGCAYGYSCVYTDTISWASPTEPLPMVRDPAGRVRPVVRRRRYAGAARRDRRTRPQHPRLGVDRDLADAQRDLGPTDRARMDEYLDDIREIERRIQKIEARNIERRAARAARRADRRARLVRGTRQADVRPAGAGVRGDVTRVFSFKMGRDGSGRVYPESGVPLPSTRRRITASTRPRIAQFAQINKYHVEPAAVLPRQAEEDPGRRRHAARQDADHLRFADGRLERAQPQALPAVPRRPRQRQARRATCTSRRRTARRWRTSMLTMLHDARPRRHPDVRRQHRRVRFERRCPPALTDAQANQVRARRMPTDLSSDVRLASLSRCCLARLASGIVETTPGRRCRDGAAIIDAVRRC